MGSTAGAPDKSSRSERVRSLVLASLSVACDTLESLGCESFPVTPVCEQPFVVVPQVQMAAPQAGYVSVESNSICKSVGGL